MVHLKGFLLLGILIVPGYYLFSELGSGMRIDFLQV